MSNTPKDPPDFSECVFEEEPAQPCSSTEPPPPLPPKHTQLTKEQLDMIYCRNGLPFKSYNPTSKICMSTMYNNVKKEVSVEAQVKSLNIPQKFERFWECTKNERVCEGADKNVALLALYKALLTHTRRKNAAAKQAKNPENLDNVLEGTLYKDGNTVFLQWYYRVCAEYGVEVILNRDYLRTDVAKASSESPVPSPLPKKRAKKTITPPKPIAHEDPSPPEPIVHADPPPPEPIMHRKLHTFSNYAFKKNETGDKLTSLPQYPRMLEFVNALEMPPYEDDPQLLEAIQREERADGADIRVIQYAYHAGQRLYNQNRRRFPGTPEIPAYDGFTSKELRPFGRVLQHARSWQKRLANDGPWKWTTVDGKRRRIADNGQRKRIGQTPEIRATRRKLHDRPIMYDVATQFDGDREAVSDDGGDQGISSNDKEDLGISASENPYSDVDESDDDPYSETEDRDQPSSCTEKTARPDHVIEPVTGSGPDERYVTLGESEPDDDGTSQV